MTFGHNDTHRMNDICTLFEKFSLPRPDYFQRFLTSTQKVTARDISDIFIVNI